jgi:hypothetical protein
LYDPRDRINAYLKIYSHVPTCMNAICNMRRVEVTINTKPIGEEKKFFKKRVKLAVAKIIKFSYNSSN